MSRNQEAVLLQLLLNNIVKRLSLIRRFKVEIWYLG
jgi:hypothetical protein